MKFRCKQQILAKAVNIVSKAVSLRTTIPILKGILIKAENGKIRMYASNLDIAISDTIEADVEEEGSIVVTAKLFGNIIRKMPSTDIEIESEEGIENNVFIRCSTSNFKIVGMAVDDFPVMNVERSDDFISFDKKSLGDMIEKTAFAASIDEARGIITGVLIEMKEDEMNMVAIDGYRMAITRKSHVSPNPEKIIISVKTLSEVSRILSDMENEENEVRLYLNDKKAIFEIGNVEADLKIMEGDFINYKDIIPKESKINIKIEKDILLDSIERASLLSKAGKNNLICMNVKGDVVTITSNSEEGDVREELTVEKEGDDIEIGFNAQYIIDVLKNIEDKEIRMLFNEPVKPCLIEPLEGRDYEYLVLPVRI